MKALRAWFVMACLAATSCAHAIHSYAPDARLCQAARTGGGDLRGANVELPYETYQRYLAGDFVPDWSQYWRVDIDGDGMADHVFSLGHVQQHQSNPAYAMTALGVVFGSQNASATAPSSLVTRFAFTPHHPPQLDSSHDYLEFWDFPTAETAEGGQWGSVRTRVAEPPQPADERRLSIDSRTYQGPTDVALHLFRFENVVYVRATDARHRPLFVVRYINGRMLAVRCAWMYE